MKKIAICGNIASGKSTVQKIIEDFGYKVLDTDDAAHRLLTVKNKQLYDAFKDYDVFENNEFSRSKLGKLVFGNDSIKTLLEKILHPQIKEEIKKFFDDNKSDKILFVGIPLLFEADMQDLFDIIVFVKADDNTRLARLLTRNNYTLEYAKSRIASQMPQDIKIKQSDFVIGNDGSLDNLKKQVVMLFEQIR